MYVGVIFFIQSTTTFSDLYRTRWTYVKPEAAWTRAGSGGLGRGQRAPAHQLVGLGERCKLPQWVPAAQNFCGYFIAQETRIKRMIIFIHQYKQENKQHKRIKNLNTLSYYILMPK